MSMIGNLLRVKAEELEEYLNNSSLLEDRIYTEVNVDDPYLIDIDKSWEGILFLLTGSGLENEGHPLMKVLVSGQAIDEDQDMGYGPANYLRPEEVKELHAVISTIDRAELLARYDGKKMEELGIYPSGAWNQEESRSYLFDNFEDVQRFYRLAAENDEAIITFVN